MVYTKQRTLNLNGQLYSLDSPKVMGIINITPDSFYDGGQYTKDETLRKRIMQIVDEGADMIDIGAYSSRPGAKNITSEEEWTRLQKALQLLVDMNIDIPISVDTFRSEIAQAALQNFPVSIINDISGGQADEKMFDVIGKYRATYILMHMQGTPQTMMQHTQYKNLIGDILLYFSDKVERLKQKGVKDIIIDPGFGFAKDLDQNYRLLSELELFSALNLPLLVGVSRKSMVYNLLKTTADEALNGTTVIQTMALNKGTDILRVHDVKAAKEAITIMNELKN